MNNGSCGLPLVSDETVAVTEAALTVAPKLTSLITCSVEPDGLENCRWLGPSAAFNCATTEAIPPVKLIPIRFGLAFGKFCNGSAVESSTRTIEICCWLPVELSV